MSLRPRYASCLGPTVIAVVLVVLAASAFSPDGTLFAQETTDSNGWQVSPFRPLDLPAPNAVRTASGRPGPDYWQQSVEYAIQATIDTATHTLSGTERVRYTNHSPHILEFLWLNLDGGLCGEASIGSRLNQPPLLFGDAVFDFSCTGGSDIRIARVESGGTALQRHEYGTTMRVDLPAALAPGATLELDIEWEWVHPEYGYGRTGRDGTLYQVAQWYPRMAVYDDLNGWNIDPFLGAGEFYQEWGSFDVQLTVPAGYVVTATGTLQNPVETLTADQRSRLDRARSSSSPVAVITADEARAGTGRAIDGMKTWHFAADSVHDFAFAMAPNFRWDASDLDGILIQTFYRPEATPWEEANLMSRSSIGHFSRRLAQYPWPHATTVEGPNEGMEYPMLTFVPSYESREDLFWVLTHEFGHEWYPMLVASNERLHPWMDEGFNTFIDIGSVEEYFADEPYADYISTQPLELHADHATEGTEQPMALRPVEQHDLYWAAYFKPALMLYLLQNEVLGLERFDRAFSEYTRAWSFRHPSPADFFRFMEDASGMDLDWFWREWVYETARLDQAVTGVESGEDGASEVTLGSLGSMVMPVEFRVTYADGESEIVRLPVEMWNLGPSFTWRGPSDREVRRIELDPRRVYPDMDRSNDVCED